MTHIGVSKLIIISSYNDLSPSRRQAINWTNCDFSPRSGHMNIVISLDFD